jgi:hypothetical protein
MNEENSSSNTCHPSWFWSFQHVAYIFFMQLSPLSLLNNLAICIWNTQHATFWKLFIMSPTLLFSLIYFLWDNTISPGNVLMWNSSPSMFMVSGVYATNSCLQESTLVTKTLGVPATGSCVYLACNIDHFPSSFLSYENWLSQQTAYTPSIAEVVIFMVVQSVLNHSGNIITISWDSVWCICWITT